MANMRIRRTYLHTNLLVHAERLVSGLLCTLFLLLAGCASTTPDFTPAKSDISPTWAAPLPHGGQMSQLNDWWSQFDDSTLMRLIEAAEKDSPNLERALANIDNARSSLGSAESGRWPSIGGKISNTRTRQLGGIGGAGGAGMPATGTEGQIPTMTYGYRSAGLDVSWELDLFGKVRRNAEAASSRLSARVKDWHAARISLAAEVADTYVQYRGCRLLEGVYQDHLKSMQETDQATRQSIAAGLTAPSDGMRTRASLAGSRSQLEAQRVSCRLLKTALRALTGIDEALLSSWLGDETSGLPQPKAFLVEKIPANALRQRPDIAALEAEVAATSAAVGAARADLYPSLSLSGNIAVAVYSLVSSSIRTWSFGPSLAIPLLDGGKRRSAVDGAEANFRLAQAEWRRGVRSAVKEVEEALLNLDGAAHRNEEAANAAAAHQDHYVAMERQWQEGGSSLLELEEARRSALDARIQHLTLRRDQVRYWIALYKAMGGGWSPEAPKADASPDQAMTPERRQARCHSAGCAG